VADLMCPGCGGSLPDCPCRSGLTAGTFSTGSAWPSVTLASIREAAAELPPPPEFNKVAASERLTGSQHCIDPRSRVLFVSPEAFAKLLEATRG
jgi:hypothetical protein